MRNYTKEDLEEALQVVSSTISRCENMQSKFAEGTSQHTLLRNRIQALYIAKALIAGENITEIYSDKELKDALPPVSSIISKCEKAQLKHQEGSSHHTRLQKMIQAMYLSKSLITDEIDKRS